MGKTEIIEEGGMRREGEKGKKGKEKKRMT